jgi:hypothetical protein
MIELIIIDIHNIDNVMVLECELITSISFVDGTQRWMALFDANAAVWKVTTKDIESVSIAC